MIQQKGKIDFKLTLEPDLKLVLGKYSDYYRVILNLLTNSIESIDTTGVISFTTSNIDDGTRVELRIKDSGKGIDRKMPEMDGLECIQEISSANYNIPIILASGSPTDSGKIDKVNVNKIINKPYNFEELLSLVRELIG